ncbi:MAG: S9 family peptidase [Pseudomonadota bacterium]
MHFFNNIRFNFGRGFALLACSFFATPGANAAQALTAQSLLDWSYVADARWSPVDDSLVFVRTDTDAGDNRYRSSLWLIHATEPPRALTNANTQARHPRWSPDGQSIAFLSDRSGSSQVHLLPLRGGESRQVTEVKGNVSAFSWSPDGSQLALLVRLKDSDEAKKSPFVTQRLDSRRDGRQGYRPAQRQRLAIYTFAKPAAERFTLLTDGRYDDGAPVWSKNGKQLFFSAAQAVNDDREILNSELYAVDLSADQPTVRVLTDNSGPDFAPLPSPDGRYLAYLGYASGTPPVSYRPNELRLLDLSGETETRVIAGNFVYAIGDGMAGDVNSPAGGGGRVQWLADSSGLLFTSAIEGQVQLMRADLASDDVQAVTSIESGEIREFDLSPQGNVAAVFSRPDLPANLVSFPVSQGSRGAWRQLTSLNAEVLKKSRIAEYEEVFAEAEDGGRVQGWLIAPPRVDRRKSYPLILYIHGGPHGMYGTNFFHEFQVLANAGYYVLIANPRGSTGYGESFGNSIQYAYPGKDYDDLMAILDSVVSRRTIDEERLGVAGGSGGGLLTTWIVSKTDRFKAASAHRSVTNWYSFVGTSDFNLYFATHWFDEFPWEAPQKYLDRSPLSFVDKVNTPVQILHSDSDYRTPLEQSLQYYTALKMLGKPAELVIFPDESHGLSRGGKPANRVARLDNILRWFDRYLMP